MALRLDTYDSIALSAGKDIADVVVTRIAKLVMDKVRTEDSVARVAHATFMVVAAGTSAPHMMAVAQRLQRELDDAKVRYREQPLKFICSLGVASVARPGEFDRRPDAPRAAAAAAHARGGARGSARRGAGRPAGRARARAALPGEPGPGAARRLRPRCSPSA